MVSTVQNCIGFNDSGADCAKVTLEVFRFFQIMEHTAEAEDWQTSTGLQFHVLRADKPFYFARGVAHNDIDNCNLIVMAAGYSYEDYYAILDILIPITGKDHLLAWLQEIDWQER